MAGPSSLGVTRWTYTTIGRWFGCMPSTRSKQHSHTTFQNTLSNFRNSVKIGILFLEKVFPKTATNNMAYNRFPRHTYTLASVENNKQYLMPKRVSVN